MKCGKRLASVFLALCSAVFTYAVPVTAESGEIGSIDILLNGEKPLYLNEIGNYTATCSVTADENMTALLLVEYIKDGTATEIKADKKSIASGETVALSGTVTADKTEDSAEIRAFCWQVTNEGKITGTAAKRAVLDTRLPFNEITSFKIPSLGERFEQGFIIPAHQPRDDIKEKFYIGADGNWKADTYTFGRDKIYIFAPPDADLSEVTPQIELAEGAQVTPAGAVDLRSPKEFVVTAQNGTARSYTVTVCKARSNAMEYYYNENFETEPLDADGMGSKFEKLNEAYTLSSGNTLVQNVLTGSSYSQIVQDDNQKAIRCVGENGNVRVRFPFSLSMGGGIQLMSWRFKAEQLGSGESRINCGAPIQMTFAADKTTGEYILNAPQRLAELGRFAPGSRHDVTVIFDASSAVGDTVPGEVYYFFDGELITDATGAFSENLRAFLNAFYPETGNGGIVLYDDILCIGK